MQKDRKQRKKENQRFRKRLASDKPLEQPKKKQKIKSCDELLTEEKDSGMEMADEETTESNVGAAPDEEIVLDTSKRDASRKKMKKQAKKRLKMYQQALALEEEREQEAAESRKAAVVEANRRSSLDESEGDGKTTRLSIRMDKCQVKYFDKKEKLKYETSDAYDPDNTPTRSILKKRS